MMTLVTLSSSVNKMIKKMIKKMVKKMIMEMIKMIKMIKMVKVVEVVRIMMIEGMHTLLKAGGDGDGAPRLHTASALDHHFLATDPLKVQIK